MNQHVILPRAIARAPQANSDPARILAELQSSVALFSERHGKRIEAVEASIDQLGLQLAANRLNGGGGGPVPAGVSREAIAALGRYAKTDDPAAFSALTPQASASKVSDPDGGYLVPDEVSSTILSLQRTMSGMRKVARVVRTKSHSYKHPINRNGTASGWVSEKQARPETAAMNLAMIEFPSGEIYANPAVTQGLLDDSDFDVGSFLVDEIAKEFDDKEGAAFITGNGIEKPRGFLDATVYIGAGTGSFGQIEAVKSGAASDFAATNPWFQLVDVLQALKAKHRMNATWLMNSATQGKISKFVDAQGQPIWRQSLIPGTPDTLLGRPVQLDENMPDVGTNAYPVAIGDWQEGYLINDRFDVRVLRDPYTNKPFVHFYTTKRVGGDVLNAEAIKLLKIAA